MVSGAELELLRPVVRRAVSRVVQQAEDAEDVVQAVLLALWEMRARVEPQGMRGLAWRVATRYAWLERTKQARRAELAEMVGEAWLAEVADGRRGALDCLLAAELGELLAQRMRRLPDPQREALDLAYGQGLSAVQAGARLGLSPKCVEARVLTARRKLQAALGTYLRGEAQEVAA